MLNLWIAVQTSGITKQMKIILKQSAKYGQCLIHGNVPVMPNLIYLSYPHTNS